MNSSLSLIPMRSQPSTGFIPPVRNSNDRQPMLPLQPESSPPPLDSFRAPREPLLPYRVIDQVSALPPILRQGSGHLTGLIAQHLPSKQDYMRERRIGLSHPGLKSELQKIFDARR